MPSFTRCKEKSLWFTLKILFCFSSSSSSFYFLLFKWIFLFFSFCFYFVSWMLLELMTYRQVISVDIYLEVLLRMCVGVCVWVLGALCVCVCGGIYICLIYVWIDEYVEFHLIFLNFLHVLANVCKYEFYLSLMPKRSRIHS